MKVYLRKTCKESLFVVGVLYESDLDITHVWIDDSEGVPDELPGYITARNLPVLIDGSTTILGDKAICDYLLYKGL